MRLTVKAGAEKLRQATVKLPGSLRFTRGKRFDRNFDAGGAQAKHGTRKLKLSSKKPAKRLRARLGSGALEADEGLRRGAHPKFKVTVRDAEGRRTKLTVRGR